jgi:hypothetical protein
MYALLSGEVVALYHYREAERLEAPTVVGESVLLQVSVWHRWCFRFYQGNNKDPTSRTRRPSAAAAPRPGAAWGAVAGPACWTRPCMAVISTLCGNNSS